MGSRGQLIMGVLFVALGATRLVTIGQPPLSGGMLLVGILWLLQGWRTRRREVAADHAAAREPASTARRIVECERGGHFTTT